MKRSEMLDYIKEDLLEKLSHRYLEHGEGEKWAEFTANELLDMVEGFGMFPPTVRGGSMNGWNRWEPEDE